MERALDREPSQLPLLDDPGQVTLPPGSSGFRSVKWQDQVTTNGNTLWPESGPLHGRMESHGGLRSGAPHPYSSLIILKFLVLFE